MTVVMTAARRRFSGPALLAARMEAGLSRLDLSRVTGIPVDTIRDYERGRYVPSVDRLGDMADALHVPVDALFAESDVTKED